jgi:hypothetical protein
MIRSEQICRSRLLLSALLLAPACFGQPAMEAPPPRLIVDTSLAVATKYMTHGFNVGDDNPNLQPTVQLGLPGTGLSFIYWASLPLDRRDDRYDEHDAKVAWSDPLPVAGLLVPVRLAATYFYYPNLSVAQNRYGQSIKPVDKSGAKLSAGLSSPSLDLGGGFFARLDYDLYHWIPLTTDLFAPGTAQEIGVDLAMPTLDHDPSAGAALGAPSVHYAVNHHDVAFGVKPGWSHAYAELSLPFRLGRERFQLDLTHQWSWEESVCRDDETWVMLSWFHRW